MRRTVLALALIACSSSESGSTPAPADGGADGTTKGRALCIDGKSVDGEYPKTEYDVSTLATPPDLSFDGEAGKIHLHDYFEPCAERSRLLVIRVAAPWCGNCLWDLKHTNEIRSLDGATGVRAWPTTPSIPIATRRDVRTGRPIAGASTASRACSRASSRNRTRT